MSNDKITLTGNTGEPGNIQKLRSSIGIDPTAMLLSRLMQEFLYKLAEIDEDQIDRVSFTLTADIEYI